MSDVLIYALGVVVFLLGVAASIALHEVGHLWPAKRFGVKVTQYFVGFGKKLWSVQRGETEYGVKAIPLGGYVKLVGMLPVYLQSAVNPLRRLHEVYPEARGGPALLSHTWHCYDTHVPATAEVLPVLLDAMAQAASALGARWYGFVNVQRGGALSRDLRAAGDA